MLMVSYLILISSMCRLHNIENRVCYAWSTKTIGSLDSIDMMSGAVDSQLQRPALMI